MERLSLLYPQGKEDTGITLSEETLHDLAAESLCERLSRMENEKGTIRRIMSKLSGDPEVIRYRCDVFEDILKHPKLREDLGALLDRVDFLKTYGSFGKESDAAGIWELVHRLNEMDEYIQCVQAIYECLDRDDVGSEGLLALKDYVRKLYEDNGFSELKKDIEKMKADTGELKSVTLGVNLNDRIEPNGIGIVSINSKYFTKSGIISNFCDFLSRGNEIQKDAEWQKKYTYHTSSGEDTSAMTNFMINHPAMAGIVKPPSDGQSEGVMQYLDRAASAMLSGTVKKLKRLLSRHVAVSTYVISELIPEFLYYVRWAEYVENLMQKGYPMCKPRVLESGERSMEAREIYNMRLVDLPSEEIVKNDLIFDRERRLYILTGANRGGKTTITQAVGIAFLMAQGGIYAPAREFAFSPTGNILTQFPADENKTLDLGRLGEESKRFRDIFMKADSTSLFLLNESFSTTSFEEGFYIAYDVVRALRDLGARTIYNTHMHKLAEMIEELNKEGSGDSLTASLVAETEDGRRSYKIRLGKPRGRSYAEDIARKYGVTYQQLTERLGGKR